MKFLTSKTFIIAAVSLVVIGGGVAAWHMADRERYVISHLVDKLDDELRLSDAQSRQIETVLRESMQALRSRREARVDSVTALLKQPRLSADEVQRAIDARRANPMRAERDAVVADAVAQVHAILEPAQRADLAAWLEDRLEDDWLRDGRRHRHHRFGHRWLH